MGLRRSFEEALALDVVHVLADLAARLASGPEPEDRDGACIYCGSAALVGLARPAAE